MTQTKLDPKVQSFTKFPRPELFPVKQEHTNGPYNVTNMSNQKAVSFFLINLLGNSLHNLITRISKVRKI